MRAGFITKASQRKRKIEIRKTKYRAGKLFEKTKLSAEAQRKEGVSERKASDKEIENEKKEA
jgi:hypothetical protein